MSDWHRQDPLAWDMAGDWDGRVIWSRGLGQFVRYLDRNGEHIQTVSAGPDPMLSNMATSQKNPHPTQAQNNSTPSGKVTSTGDANGGNGTPTRGGVK